MNVVFSLDKSQIKDIASELACVVRVGVLVDDRCKPLDPGDVVHLSKVHDDVLEPCVLVAVWHDFLLSVRVLGWLKFFLILAFIFVKWVFLFNRRPQAREASASAQFSCFPHRSVQTPGRLRVFVVIFNDTALLIGGLHEFMLGLAEVRGLFDFVLLHQRL